MKRILLSLAALLLPCAGMAQILVDGKTSETVTLNSSTQFANIVVTSSSPPTAFTFTVSQTEVPSSYQWVRACVGSSCAAAGATAGNGATNTMMSIQIIRDLAAGFGSGPFHATITLAPGATISVVFAPGQMISSATPVTPSSLTVGVASGGSAANMLTMLNNTGAALNILQIVPTTNDGNNWLGAMANPTTIPAAGSSTITVTTSAGSLPNRTYTGQIQIFLDTSPTVTIPVTFTVGATGLTLSTVNLGLSYVNGTSQAQSVTVAGVTSYSAAASTNSGGSWLLLSAGAQNGIFVSNISVVTPLTVLVGQGVASQLATGTYTGSIVVTDASNQTNSSTVSVTLSVNMGGVTSITVTPGSLAFFDQTTTSQSIPYQTLWVSAPMGAFTATATSDRGWLYLGGNGGNAPGPLQVFVASHSGLTAGTYNGTVALTIGSLTQNVKVTLTITDNPVAQAGFTTLIGNSGTVVFNTLGTVSNPASQPVLVFASDNSALTTTVNSGLTPNWLTVTQSGNQLTITPNLGGLGSSVYSGAVVVTASNAAGTIANSPISIPVVLVTNGGANGTLSITPLQPLVFQSSAGVVTPSSVSVSVTATTATAFSVSAPSWASLSYSGNLVTPQTITVVVNPNGLTSGVYNDFLSFTAGGVRQQIPITLTVFGANTGTIFTDRASLSFAIVTGSQAQSQTVIVSSNGPPVAYTATGGASWLMVSPANGQTQSTVTVTANPAGLSPGTYQGNVTFTSGNTVTVPVTLTVQTPPMISAGTTSLTFVYLSGGSTPPAQPVTISGSTGGFTATAASDTGAWLLVSPTSGTAGASISVSVNPSGLGPGPHNGSITVVGTNGLTGQVVINVLLTVNVPLPVISVVLNGGSLEAGQSNGPISPGEVLTLKGTALGPATPLMAQVDSGGKLATQLGGVTVTVNGFLAPLIYVSATQVSAVVPYEMTQYKSAGVGVKYLGQSSNIVTLTVTPTAPGIFTQDSSGSGPGAWNPDFSLNGPNNAAPTGGAVIFFLTGEGQLVPPGSTGTINPGAQNPGPAAPISVLIDGQPATYSYAGGIEGVVQGILQLNVQIPASAHSGAVSVVVTIGGNSTQGGVTVSVR